MKHTSEQFAFLITHTHTHTQQQQQQQLADTFNRVDSISAFDDSNSTCSTGLILLNGFRFSLSLFLFLRRAID